MKFEDPCPNCGYHKKPYLMSTRSDSSLKGIWNGADGAFMAVIMRVGFIIVAFLVLAAIISYLH